MAEQRGPTTHEVVLQRFTDTCNAFRCEDVSQEEVSIRLRLLLEIIFNSAVPPAFLKSMVDTLHTEKESLADAFDRELHTFWSETIWALKDQIEENEREKTAVYRMREEPDCQHCGFTMQPDGTGFKCSNCGATIVTKPA